MNELAPFEIFGKGKLTEISRTNHAVLYTRVSTSEQQNGYSLDVQFKDGNEFAKKYNYNIIGYFGGGYESASTDERKEFNRMLDFIKKSKLRITYIIVHMIDRFSRSGPNAIYIKEQLRKTGVFLLSVRQPVDVHSINGDFQQNLQILLSHNDNQIRREKCMSGTKEALLQGNWVTHPPLGYEIVRTKGKREIIINDTGKLIRKAFLWKSSERISNNEIRNRLADLGLKLPFQRISEMLKNPFYCGILVHSALEGMVVEGNHEKLISKELFLKVNDIQNQNHHGYITKDGDNNIPLKQFLRCDTCNKYMRGYLVHKKKKYYYKCNTPSCRNNKSAQVLNGTFASIAERFTLNISSDLVNLIKTQMVATFNQKMGDQVDEAEIIRKKVNELSKKLERLEERFIDEELTKELYVKHNQKLLTEKNNLEIELSKSKKQMSNLDECIEKVISYSLNLASEWTSADYSTKQRIQFWLFPEGISYNKESDRCRTTSINSVFLYIARQKQDLLNEKSGIPELNLSYSALVARRGVEPLFPG